MWRFSSSISTFFINFSDFCEIFRKRYIPWKEVIHEFIFRKTRNSHRRCSIIKNVLKNFVKFTGNLYQGLFFNKVAGFNLWHRCFPVDFTKFFWTAFFAEHLCLVKKSFSKTVTKLQPAYQGQGKLTIKGILSIVFRSGFIHKGRGLSFNKKNDSADYVQRLF